MLNFYLFTERLRYVIENNERFSFGELDSIRDRVKVSLYLAEIYKCPCPIECCELDYENLYKVFYVICLPDFGKCLEPRRITYSKEFIKGIKSGQANLKDLITKLLKYNGYS